MTKVDIISGFLGAGKTTLIKKLLKEAYQGEKLVLIENEFGEISIDGGFLKESGVQISEMSSGCICCSLVGDFGKALKDVEEQFHPDRILIEPSGVGKLSRRDPRRAEHRAGRARACSSAASSPWPTRPRCKVYMKNFGEFYNNQIESAERHHPLPHAEAQRGEAHRRRGAAARAQQGRRHPHHPLGRAGRQDHPRRDGEGAPSPTSCMEKIRAEHEADEA